jgi:hypothetical protein
VVIAIGAFNPDELRRGERITVPGYGNPIGRLPKGDESAQIAQLFRVALDPHIKVGRRLNGAENGMQKEIYALDDRWVLRVTNDAPKKGHYLEGVSAWDRAWLMLADYKALTDLQRRGRRVPAFLTTGTYKGKPADIVERFQCMSPKEPGWEQKVAQLRGTGLEQDILGFEKLLNQGVVPVDLQLGFKPGMALPLDLFEISDRRTQPDWYKADRDHLARVKKAVGI